MENYRQKYEQALERAKGMYEQGMMPERIEYIFPELKESEDERIRKELIMFLECCQDTRLIGNEKRDKWILWLEKQGEQKFGKCKQEAKPNGGIVYEDFNGGEGFYKLNLDYLNKKQVEEIEELVRMWNKELKTSNEDIKNCIGTCLTDKVEPKFHEGDWLCENELNNYSRFIQILEIINVQGKERYRISRDIHNDEDIVEFNFLEKYYHKFDIKDAENGDVLCYKDDILLLDYYFLFNKVGCHCCYTNKGFIPHNIYSFTRADFDKIRPATKEQCDFLFSKMKELGYKWDSNKKELIKQ